MAKLYWTKDIKKLIDKKIEHDSAILVNDKEIREEEIARFVRDIRTFQIYAYELIKEMEEADRKDDEYMASLKASLNSRIKDEGNESDDNG